MPGQSRTPGRVPRASGHGLPEEAGRHPRYPWRMIRGAHAGRPALPGPRDPAQGLELERLPLVEAHYGRARRTRPVEPPDAVFFRSNDREPPLGIGGLLEGREATGLNRWTHSYTIVTLHPTRSATSANARPRATSAMSRYRRCRRTVSRRSLTLACSTRRSARVKARSRTDLAMLSLLGDSVGGSAHYPGQIKLGRH
jgi:hypothetical protein